MITEDGRSEKEIKCRIGMAKSKFYDNVKIFTGQLSTTTKKQMIKSLVWSIALYAAEAWTMRKVDTQRYLRHLKCGGGEKCSRSVIKNMSPMTK